MVRLEQSEIVAFELETRSLRIHIGRETKKEKALLGVGDEWFRCFERTD